MKKLFSIVFIIFFFLFKHSFSAHPLITDDTGTQGKGNLQIELNCEFEYDENLWSKGIDTIFSYGLIDKADIVFTVPYQFITSDEKGISDISLELKYRFYEKEGLSFALKPGISFPTGDETKSLGTGKTAYSIYFIGTKENKNSTIHFNLGYLRNENVHDEKENIYHVSVAIEVPINEKFKFVGNLCGETNPDKSTGKPVLVSIVGFIYSPKENFDIAFGIKFGLNDVSPDFSILPGITIRF
jgi:hypothetical protein